MQRYSLLHVRCGTAFLLYVMVIAIFVFAFFGRPAWYWLIATRILLLPGHRRDRLRGHPLRRQAPAHVVLGRSSRPASGSSAHDPRATLDQIEVSIRALRECSGWRAGSPRGAQGRSHGCGRRNVPRPPLRAGAVRGLSCAGLPPMAGHRDDLVEELERSYAEAQERMSDPAVFNDQRTAAEAGRRPEGARGRTSSPRSGARPATTSRPTRGDGELARAGPELEERGPRGSRRS